MGRNLTITKMHVTREVQLTLILKNIGASLGVQSV